MSALAVDTVSAQRWMNEGGGWREREGKNKKNSDRKGREASPVRGLRASWKLSFGLGPSAVVELSCSFICFRLCDSRQKSDHRCSAWLAVAHTHKTHAHTTTGLRPSHTRLTPSLISQFELLSCCLEATTTAGSIKQAEFFHFSVLFAHLRQVWKVAQANVCCHDLDECCVHWCGGSNA